MWVVCAEGVRPRDGSLSLCERVRGRAVTVATDGPAATSAAARRHPIVTIATAAAATKLAHATTTVSLVIITTSAAPAAAAGVYATMRCAFVYCSAVRTLSYTTLLGPCVLQAQNRRLGYYTSVCDGIHIRALCTHGRRRKRLTEGRRRTNSAL